MANRVYSNDIKKACFEAFMAGRGFDDISRQFGPSAKTISRWAESEDWQTERERRQSSPLRLDQSLLSALSMEQIGLESPDGDIRTKAIERCYKIAVIRDKLGTKQVDRGPVAVALAASLKDFSRKHLAEYCAPEHRKVVAEATAKLMLDWFATIQADPTEALS
jgi:hypothetical protein